MKAPRLYLAGPARMIISKPKSHVPVDPYDVAHRTHMLEIAASLVERHGERALPVFERCEAELRIAQSRSSALERARLVARQSRSQQDTF